MELFYIIILQQKLKKEVYKLYKKNGQLYIKHFNNNSMQTDYIKSENFNKTYKNNLSYMNNIEIESSDNMNESGITNQILNIFSREMDNDSISDLSNYPQVEIPIERDEENEESNLIGKKRGRKKKGSLAKGEHNKYSYDNMCRRIKSNLLKILLTFINSIIYEIYEDEPDYDMEKDKLMQINQKQTVDSNIEFNKNFYKETLEHIFSVKISGKYKKYNPDHNRNLIIKLLNDNNIERRQIFHNLFTKTFLECLEHFLGTKKIRELEGMKTFNEYKKELEDDKDYLETFEYRLKNYKANIDSKKGRRGRNNIE